MDECALLTYLGQYKSPGHLPVTDHKLPARVRFSLHPVSCRRAAQRQASSASRAASAAEGERSAQLQHAVESAARELAGRRGAEAAAHRSVQLQPCMRCTGRRNRCVDFLAQMCGVRGSDM